MRVAAALALALVIPACPAGAATHHYTQAQRYAGCLFGEAIPLMRHGTARERAIAAASERCIGWSTDLSAADIRDVDVEVHRAIEDAERHGL